MKYKFIGSSDKGLFEWFMQRVSGVIILIVITIHFFSMIQDGEIGMDKLITGPLLVFGIFHTFNGFKMILDDFVTNTVLRTVFIGIFWILAIVLVILGLHILL